MTGEFRGKSLFIAQDKYPGGNGTFNRASNDAQGRLLPSTNEYTTDIESWVGFWNPYADLGTCLCFTPYVGAGIGVASISVFGLKDVNVPNSGVVYPADNTETNFAWVVYGAVAYDVNESVTLDLSYRYTDLCEAKSGTVTAFDGTSSFAGTSCSVCAGNWAMHRSPPQRRSHSNSPSSIRLTARPSVVGDGRFSLGLRRAAAARSTGVLDGRNGRALVHRFHQSLLDAPRGLWSL